MNQIHKSFSWDMGHRISKHGGRCFSPHGHRYLATVWLKGALNDEGMVLDYYQLSQIVDPIVEELDHAFMVYDKDDVMYKFFDHQYVQTMIDDFTPRPFKTKVVPFESTAENIARYIFDRVREKISMIEKVEVWETPKCCAVYSLDEVCPQSAYINDVEENVDNECKSYDHEETDGWGNKRYYNEKNQLHNLAGPAIEFANGYKAYYVDDKLHRTDGPAVEWPNGDKAYYIDGKRHRIDGPAIEWADGSKFYYVDGRRHRTDGPAVEYTNGDKAYWVDDKWISKEEFDRLYA